MPPAQRCADLPTPCLQALVQQHLDACARLRLCQTSKGLAAVVLQHAACCTLTLQHPEGYRGYVPPGGWTPTDVRKAALQGIMAGAATALRVVLKGGDGYSPLSPLWSSLPLPQVTHLTLKSVKLSNEVVRNLQLQQCTQLQHLKMAEYQWVTDGWDIARQMAKDWKEWLPPSLTSVEAGMFARPDAPVSIQPFLTENLTTFSTWLLHDQLLDMLAELPHLTHVTVTERIDISCNHNDKRWLWQELEFIPGCHLSTLEQLPLQHIPQIRMHCMPFYPRNATDTTSQAIARLASHPGFRIVPTPLEGLDVPYLMTTKEAPPELLQLCLARLETRPCALYLHQQHGVKLCFSDTRDYVVSQLQQLPDYVTAIVFLAVDYHTFPSDAEECKKMWKPILAALPKQITQIALHMKDMPSLPVAEGLMAALEAHEPCASVKMIINLYDSYHSESVDEQSELEQAAYAQVLWKLRQLAKEHPGRVSVLAVKQWPEED